MMRHLADATRRSSALVVVCAALWPGPSQAQPAAAPAPSVTDAGTPVPAGKTEPAAAPAPAVAPAPPPAPEAVPQRAPTPAELEAAVVARMALIPKERVDGAASLAKKHIGNLARVNRIEKLAMEANDKELLALSRRLRELEVERAGKERIREERLLRLAISRLPPFLWNLGPADQAAPAGVDAGTPPPEAAGQAAAVPVQERDGGAP